MAAKVFYAIIGRYMNGKEVTGYQLQDESGKSKRYTKEQVYFLVGKGAITNCSGQIYEDKVILKGKGINLNDLPIADERKGSIRNTEAVGKVRKGKTSTDVMNQCIIVGRLEANGRTVGYTVKNAGGATRKLKREDVLTLAKNGGIGNARVQMYKGKPLLRGVGVNLNDLPSEEMQTKAKAQAPVPKKEAPKRKEPKAEEIQDKKLKEVAKALKEKVNKIVGVKVVDEDLVAPCGTLMIKIGKKDATIDINVSDKVEYTASWWKDGDSTGIIAGPTNNPSAIITKLVTVASKENEATKKAPATKTAPKKEAPKKETKKTPAPKKEAPKKETPKKESKGEQFGALDKMFTGFDEL